MRPVPILRPRAEFTRLGPFRRFLFHSNFALGFYFQCWTEHAKRNTCLLRSLKKGNGNTIVKFGIAKVFVISALLFFQLSVATAQIETSPPVSKTVKQSCVNRYRFSKGLELLFSLAVPNASASGGCSCPIGSGGPHDPGCSVDCFENQSPNCSCGVRGTLSTCWCG